MERIELSAEHRAFQEAARLLAARIRADAATHNYDLDGALNLVENGNLTVTILDERGGMMGFTGLPGPVGLFLTASACGGLFPQAPQ